MFFGCSKCTVLWWSIRTAKQKFHLRWMLRDGRSFRQQTSCLQKTKKAWSVWMMFSEILSFAFESFVFSDCSLYDDSNIAVANVFNANNSINLSKLVILSVNGESVIVRSCHWEKRSELRNECFKNSKNNMTSLSTTEFCETCDSDGCNGAIQHCSNLLLVFFPVCIFFFTISLKM